MTARQQSTTPSISLLSHIVIVHSTLVLCTDLTPFIFFLILDFLSFVIVHMTKFWCLAAAPIIFNCLMVLFYFIELFLYTLFLLHLYLPLFISPSSCHFFLPCLWLFPCHFLCHRHYHFLYLSPCHYHCLWPCHYHRLSSSPSGCRGPLGHQGQTPKIEDPSVCPSIQQRHWHRQTKVKHTVQTSTGTGFNAAFMLCGRGQNLFRVEVHVPREGETIAFREQ